MHQTADILPSIRNHKSIKRLIPNYDCKPGALIVDRYCKPNPKGMYVNPNCPSKKFEYSKSRLPLITSSLSSTRSSLSK